MTINCLRKVQSKAIKMITEYCLNVINLDQLNEIHFHLMISKPNQTIQTSAIIIGS